jgi:hypothetical protein
MHISEAFAELKNGTYPVIVVFPPVLAYELRVYEKQNFVVGTFISADSALAIYFSIAESLGATIL